MNLNKIQAKKTIMQVDHECLFPFCNVLHLLVNSCVNNLNFFERPVVSICVNNSESFDNVHSWVDTTKDRVLAYKINVNLN